MTELILFLCVTANLVMAAANFARYRKDENPVNAGLTMLSLCGAGWCGYCWFTL